MAAAIQAGFKLRKLMYSGNAVFPTAVYIIETQRLGGIYRKQAAITAVDI